MPDPKFADMTQSEIETMFSNRFKDADLGGGPRTRTRTEPSQADIQRQTQASAEYRRNLTRAEESGKTIVGSLSKLPSAVVNTYDQSIAAFEEDFGGLIENINRIQQAYGGVSSEIENSSEAAKRAIERYYALECAVVDAEGEGQRLTQQLGLQSEGITNYFDKYFESSSEIVTKQQAVIGLLETQHGTYVKNMDEATLSKIPAYSDALGVSAGAIAEVLEAQIVSTGKASTEILDNVAAYANNISDEINVPQQKIAEFATRMIADTKTFGFVTAEEATRAAASLTQLGLKFEDLSNLQRGFIDFGTSAETAAKFSQIAGVQMDAFELTYIANEKPEELAEYLRNQFISQGFTADRFKSMSKAMQRQLAAAFPSGVDFNQIFGLIDTERPLKDWEAIAASQKATKDAVIDTGKAFAEVTKNLTDVEGYSEKSADALEKLRKRALLPLANEAYRAETNMSDLNSSITAAIQLPELGEQFSGFMGDFNAQLETFNDKIRSGEYAFDLSSMLTFGDGDGAEFTSKLSSLGVDGANAYIEGQTNTLREGGNLPQSLPPFWQEIVSSVGDPANYSEFLPPIEQFGFEIGNSFDLGIRSAVEENSLMDLLSGVVNPEEGAGLIRMMDDNLSSQVVDEGFALGKDFGMSFVDGIRDLGVADDIKGLTEAVETGITSESVTQKYEQITNKISEVSENTHEKNVALINDVLKPIIENVVVELQKLNVSNNSIASKNEVTSVNIDSRNLVDIVKKGIVESPETYDGRAIQISRSE